MREMPLKQAYYMRKTASHWLCPWFWHVPVLRYIRQEIVYKKLRRSCRVGGWLGEHVTISCPDVSKRGVKGELKSCSPLKV